MTRCSSSRALQLENIEFTANYLHSIEQRMLAEVEVQKLQQNAEREKVQAQITVTQATAKANAVRAEAQANADATRLNGEAQATNIRITGEAQAAAIEARAKALGTNPNLVTLVQAERWNGVLPTTMVPGSAVPFVSRRKRSRAQRRSRLHVLTTVRSTVPSERRLGRRRKPDESYDCCRAHRPSARHSRSGLPV